MSLIGASTLSPSFTAPLVTGLRTTGPLYFQLSVTTGEGTDTDMVTIVPRNDTISIGSARWKQGDFRISGTGTVNGASITVRNPAGQPLGTATVVAGAWTLRIRTGVADPIQVMATSNNGGTTGLVATTPLSRIHFAPPQETRRGERGGSPPFSERPRSTNGSARIVILMER